MHYKRRRGPNFLQNQINASKVWFASRCQANTKEFELQSKLTLPIDYKNKNDQSSGVGVLIEDQDVWIDETKAQLALIEVRATSSGTLQYDLPQSLRRLEGDQKIRKDHYSCILLAAWSAKIYWDMLFAEREVQVTETFAPILI